MHGRWGSERRRVCCHSWLNFLITGGGGGGGGGQPLANANTVEQLGADANVILDKR